MKDTLQAVSFAHLLLLVQTYLLTGTPVQILTPEELLQEVVTARCIRS
jgi:hypothetical protein